MSDETRFKTETVKYGTNYCQHGVIICMPCQTCTYDALKLENEKLRAKLAKYEQVCKTLEAQFQLTPTRWHQTWVQQMKTLIEEARAALESEGEK